MDFTQDRELYQRSNQEPMEEAADDTSWLEVGFATDPGKSGKPNQDYYGIVETVYTLGQQSQAETPILVGVVADGISSSSSSDVAGQIVVETIRRVLVENPSIPIKPRLDAAIRRANKEVFQATQEVPEYAGTGATIVAAAFAADQLYVAHLGDSRAYLVRNRQMHLLTVDHRWGQEAVDAGEMTPEEAMTHPDRNLITRLIGASGQIEVDHHIVDIEKSSLDLSKFQRWPLVDRMWLQPGDIVLLCSDGLSDVLSTQQIEAVINRHPPQVAGQRLIEMANAAGGPDNVTVLLFKVPVQRMSTHAGSAGSEAASVVAHAPNYFLRTVTMLLLVAGLISGLWLLFNRLPFARQYLVAPFSQSAQSDTQNNANPQPAAGLAISATATSAATATPATATPASETPTIAIASAKNEVTATVAATAETAAAPAISETNTITTALVTSDTTAAPGDASVAVTDTATITSEESTITIIQPVDGESLAGIQRFEWEDAKSLSENQTYEMLIWSVTEDRTTAISVAGLSTDPFRIINLNSIGLQAGDYQWGVRVVSLDDGSEILYLGDDYSFTYAP